MMDYIVLKLATGQEIIGKIEHHKIEDFSVTLVDPFEVKSQWAADGQFQMGLIPFMPYAKNNKVIFEHMIATTEPADALIKEYTKLTSGIILP